MKIGLLLRWMLLLAFLCGARPALAEDTDLFAFSNSSTNASANVLFVMDNGANFSSNVNGMRCSITSSGNVDVTGAGGSPTNLDGKAAAVEQCALYSVIKSLATNTSVTLNIGVMVFNETGLKSYDPATNSLSSPCSVSNTGGCLVMPLTPFTNDTVKTNLLKWIRAWNTGGDNDIPCWTGTASDCDVKSNSTANGAAMQEAWAYFKGKTGVSGRSYASVMPPAGCGKNYIVFLGNAYRDVSAPKDIVNESNSPLKPLSGQSLTLDKNASPAAKTAEKAIMTDTIPVTCGGTTTSVTLQSDENKGIYALNWARYMKNNSVATTYSVGILGPSCSREYAAHLAKLGSDAVGGGGYYATNSYDSLVVSLKTVLTEIMAVNSVFAAVSLPASQNTQGEYLNQVFVGMFRPDHDFKPRWPGNLKQYQLGYYNGVLKTLDAVGKLAVNANTGFIAECARSYWTPDAVDSYWTYDPRGSCTAVAESNASNYPDGNIVEKGGQGYKLRAMTPGNRVVKTCASGLSSCTSAGLVNFTTDAVTNNQLGVSSAPSWAASADAARSTLVNWAKGQNVNGSTGLPELQMATTAMRASVHGDIVHSRPAAINHGTNDSNDLKVVVYYGANDGMLHAINGNQSSSFSSGGNTYGPGEELWSFMPPEFYGNIKRLYENTPPVHYPGTAATNATSKAYGMDGAITALKTTVNGASKTYLYATMRRGGRAVYAFDVTTPGNPQLAWKAGCASASLTDSDCTTNMSDMGQSWAPARTFYAANYGSGNTPLIIMGGGYDTCEDHDALSASGANHNCNASSKGKKVYVLNALTGAVVRSFDTLPPSSGGTARGVVAEAALVNAGGKAQYAYIPDLGGNLYRVSFSGTNENEWSMVRIASLGCSTTESCNANRKFMWQPSVVTTDNLTYSILLGSGDREKPVRHYTASNNVANYFFMVKDRPSSTTWLTSQAATCGNQNYMCLASLQGPIGTTIPDDATLDNKRGWYMALDAGEQVVTLAATYGGQTFFSTHKPATTGGSSCSSNLGDARAYCVKYTNAEGCFAASSTDSTGRFSVLTAGGLAPSPVIVNVSVSNHDYGTNSGSGTTTRSVCIGCALSESGQVGGSGSELAGVASGVGAGELGSSSANTRHKSRLYWYIEK